MNYLTLVAVIGLYNQRRLDDYFKKENRLYDNKEFLCTVEHNYFSPSNTVGIQLHVLTLYVGHLQVVI